jgi:hypothetical protein
MTKSLDFDVAYIALPYNAILGYPALARFMAAMHHGFNVLKIPSAMARPPCAAMRRMLFAP